MLDHTQIVTNAILALHELQRIDKKFVPLVEGFQQKSAHSESSVVQFLKLAQGGYDWLIKEPDIGESLREDYKSNKRSLVSLCSRIDGYFMVDKVRDLNEFVQRYQLPNPAASGQKDRVVRPTPHKAHAASSAAFLSASGGSGAGAFTPRTPRS